MKYLISITCVIMMVNASLSQATHKSLMAGDEAYQQEEYAVAETEYRRAEREGNNFKALYNLGNTLYQQERYEESAEYFNRAMPLAENPEDRFNAQYNSGNAHLMAGKVEDAILFYKQAIKTNPANSQAKYNLAVAKDALRKAKEQQEQQQQQQSQDQQEGEEGEQSEDQQEGEQQPQDQQSNGEQKDQEEKDKEEGEESDEEKEEGEDEENGEESESDPQEDPQGGGADSSRLEKQSLDSLDAQKLLEIIQDEESKVQEKLKKFNSDRTKSDKDW